MINRDSYNNIASFPLFYMVSQIIYDAHSIRKTCSKHTRCTYPYRSPQALLRRKSS